MTDQSRQAFGQFARSYLGGCLSLRLMMSDHHAQAVEMALLARDRTNDEELRRFALDIILTQQAQIGQMQGWLAVWERPLAGNSRLWVAKCRAGPPSSRSMLCRPYRSTIWRRHFCN